MGLGKCRSYCRPHGRGIRQRPFPCVAREQDASPPHVAAHARGTVGNQPFHDLTASWNGPHALDRDDGGAGNGAWSTAPCLPRPRSGAWADWHPHTRSPDRIGRRARDHGGDAGRLPAEPLRRSKKRPNRLAPSERCPGPYLSIHFRRARLGDSREMRRQPAPRRESGPAIHWSMASRQGTDSKSRPNAGTGRTTVADRCN